MKTNEELEAEIEALKKRITDLEARAWAVFTQPIYIPQPYPVPQWPVQPTYIQPWPGNPPW